MDKDKGYNDINDSIKKALDIMESPSELNEKETSGALEDDECLQTCRDIMDMNVALQQQQTPGSIDVEAELVRFKAKHTKRKPFAGLKCPLPVSSADGGHGCIFPKPPRFPLPSARVRAAGMCSYRLLSRHRISF